ncbi:MAG: hypothetical protein AAF456_04290 [Planctomycetota bacterium]
MKTGTTSQTTYPATTSARSLCLAFAVAFAMMTCASAEAQLNNIPSPMAPPKVVMDEIYDYQVYFAGPAQTGYMLHNDRGLVQGPYSTYEEADEVGMRTPWVIYWITEVDIPQRWYYWDTFDYHIEASREASWLRGLGFDTRIEEVGEWYFHLR